jgi:hypothetical protein
MSAYKKATDLGLTGTDAEIVAVLKTLGQHDLDRQDVSTWMRERGLWTVLPNGHAGALWDLYSATDNPQIKQGLADWYASTLGGQAGAIRATWPAVSVRIAAIVGLIAAVIPDGEALAAEFWSLCGGRPYAGLTVEQFTAEREAATVEAARQAAYSEIVRRANEATAAAAAMLDSGATAEEITAAGFTGWQGAEAVE